MKVELPGLGTVPQRRRLEYRVNGDGWERATVIAAALDGRVKVEHDKNTGRPEWIDLTQYRYRWYD